jgi:hypothetical protein
MGGYLGLATRVGIVRLAWLPQAELAATVSEDFSRLASDFSSFPGGTIRNVLLRTAFEAATDGQTITDAILRRCADDEQPLRKERQSLGSCGKRRLRCARGYPAGPSHSYRLSLIALQEVACIVDDCADRMRVVVGKFRRSPRRGVKHREC